MKAPERDTERAQGLLEYALILILVSIFLVAALTILGSGVLNVMYHNIISQI